MSVTLKRYWKVFLLISVVVLAIIVLTRPKPSPVSYTVPDCYLADGSPNVVSGWCETLDAQSGNYIYANRGTRELLITDPRSGASTRMNDLTGEQVVYDPSTGQKTVTYGFPWRNQNPGTLPTPASSTGNPYLNSAVRAVDQAQEFGRRYEQFDSECNQGVQASCQKREELVLMDQRTKLYERAYMVGLDTQIESAEMRQGIMDDHRRQLAQEQEHETILSMNEYVQAAESALSKGDSEGYAKYLEKARSLGDQVKDYWNQNYGDKYGQK